jgi:hypothetical protein
MNRGGTVDALDVIDVGFDFREDTPPGKDPDSHSPTLRRYHKLLWSKPLPCGETLDLDATARGHYLLHRSPTRGEFSLSSDAVVASYRYVAMVQAEPWKLQEFLHIGYTIGGMMLWPGNRVDGKMTLNGVRGFNHKIRDRFDLTLECIRRHYLGEDSPLEEWIARYADFFALFVDFRGFIEFFLLQDAVTVDCGAVIFSTPFRDFTTPAIPQTITEYREYRHRAITFIEARNRRILRSVHEDHYPDLRKGEGPVRHAVALQTPAASTQDATEAVLELAEQCGTREELERAIAVATRKGLRVRPFKACLMFAPPMDGRRCLFTLWAGPEDGKLAAYVCTEAFIELFSLGREEAEARLGEEGWRYLDEAEFDALLRGIEALDLSS